MPRWAAYGNRDPSTCVDFASLVRASLRMTIGEAWRGGRRVRPEFLEALAGDAELGGVEEKKINSPALSQKARQGRGTRQVCDGGADEESALVPNEITTGDTTGKEDFSFAGEGARATHD
jgi:hypothetical protein